MFKQEQKRLPALVSCWSLKFLNPDNDAAANINRDATVIKVPWLYLFEKKAS